MDVRRAPGRLSPVPDGLPTDVADLVDELRSGRERAGVSLAELAKVTFSSKASVSRWLSGTAMLTRVQAITWAKFCGTDEITMGDRWDAAHSTQTTVRPPADTPPPAATTPDEETAHPGRRWKWLTAGSLVMAMVIAALVVAATHRGTRAQASPGCAAGQPFTVSVPAKTRLSGIVTVGVRCQPSSDDRYILIVQLLDMGADHHPLYMAKEYLPTPQVGQSYSYIHDVSKSLVGTQRLLYVVEVSAAVDHDWQVRIKNNEQLALPDGARVVSNQAPNETVS